MRGTERENYQQKHKNVYSGCVYHVLWYRYRWLTVANQPQYYTPRKTKLVYKPVHSTYADKLTGKACRS